MKRVGENEWLLSWDEPDERTANARVLTAYHTLLVSALLPVSEAIPAARTLLVRVAGSPSEAAERSLRELERRAPGERGASSRPTLHHVVVRPDGQDLAEVLSRTGLTASGFWDALTAVRLTVGFVGFAPGFPYLLGLPPRLQVPRRPTPRPSVPVGTVALGGRYAGIYPSAMPGGWSQIGTTDLRLFDPDREPPALLGPGDEVRFHVTP